MARAARLRRHRHPPARARPARRSRRRAARRARARARPACCAAWSACSTSGRRSSPGPSWASTRSSRSPWSRKRRAAERGDDLPVEWRHRDERYAEKLATPDTSVADLIGDVDPMRVAEGRRLGDPETIHFGLIPRSHRGHRRDQRAARPRRAHPGGDAQRHGGARHPDPRLRAAAAARRARRRQRQPRGLHQPRPDHHPAQGPLRRRDPHPLPARARRRGGRHPPGGAPRRRGARRPRRDRRALHPRAALLARRRPALGRLRAVRHRRHRDGRGGRAAPGDDPGRGAGRRPGRRPRGGARRAARQDRVRVGRGGPRARGARPPAAHLDRRDLPQAARRHRPAPDRRRDRGRRPGHHR